MSGARLRTGERRISVLLPSRGSGAEVLIAVSVFETAEGALASNEMAAHWVKTNVLEPTAGAPEVIVGDVLISEVK